ncbi:hypothetical protein [Alicyclobacillus fastidiosus]|uniref:Bacterial Ig domain-containing protein n=1 Tax=Alicyclobacillus fastidiosus TaxID=392011 RepID=A0ABV5A9Y8_9BACL|nr:hypothetical protein [Alicyclobacillus fastidiosus]WEH10978.1 hypothetical protein PYS47_07110 [Alicyclobacillus fastidiosus]
MKQWKQGAAIATLTLGTALFSSTPFVYASTSDSNTSVSSPQLIAMPINSTDVTSYLVGGTGTVGDSVNVTLSDQSGHTLTLKSVVDQTGVWQIQNANVSSLADGNVEISATQTDSQGNTSAPTTNTVVKNLTAPVAPQVSSSEQTISSSNETSYTVSGTGTPRCYINISLTDAAGHQVTGIAVVKADGTWSRTIDVKPLSSGNVKITATQQNQYMNNSPASAPVNVSKTATATGTSQSVSPLLTVGQYPTTGIFCLSKPNAAGEQGHEAAAIYYNGKVYYSSFDHSGSPIDSPGKFDPAGDTTWAPDGYTFSNLTYFRNWLLGDNTGYNLNNIVFIGLSSAHTEAAYNEYEYLRANIPTYELDVYDCITEVNQLLTSATVDTSYFKDDSPVGEHEYMMGVAETGEGESPYSVDPQAADFGIWNPDTNEITIST